MFQRLRYPFLFLLLPAILSSCTSVSRYQWIPSPNFNERKANFVVIHQTDSDSHERALITLTNPAKEVSAHYLIAKDGRITQMVEEKYRAWHAGKSFWGGQTDMNSASIGIELDNKGDAPFETAQIDALLSLLDDIRARYHIPFANHLAHGDIAPGRKVDPNRHFPWKKLAEHGFGLWCDPTESPPFPNQLNTMLLLQSLGYDITQGDETVLAFHRHFRGDDSSPQLTIEDARVLSCLLKKKMEAEKPVTTNMPNATHTFKDE